MKTGKRKGLALIMTLVLLAWSGIARGGEIHDAAKTTDMTRDKILVTFTNYEARYADFIYSVKKGHGKSGKSEDVLQGEVEAYGDGPFYDALNAAQKRVCQFKDAEVLKALFRVILATSFNSADEMPAWTLGEIFLCQPDLVASTFSALPLAEQRDLYFDLEFGLEDAVYGKPKDNKTVLALRQKLQTMGVGSGAARVGEIYDAIHVGNVAKIKSLLAKSPDLVNANLNGKTPLHAAAAAYVNKDVLEVLLAKGAAVNAKDKMGHTPLHVAVEYRNNDVAEFLRQHGGVE